ncbi:MAG: hypothetical protein JWP81_3755 [Ferruginibacter sp.]|nr:hypothetical protein [Ferruginibacter sp.]
MKTAILFGATEFAGTYLLPELLNNLAMKKYHCCSEKTGHQSSEAWGVIGDYSSFPILK